MEEWVAGWLDGWMDGWMEGCKDGGMDGWSGVRMDVWLVERREESMYGGMPEDKSYDIKTVHCGWP